MTFLVDIQLRLKPAYLIPGTLGTSQKDLGLLSGIVDKYLFLSYCWLSIKAK